MKTKLFPDLVINLNAELIQVADQITTTVLETSADSSSTIEAILHADDLKVNKKLDQILDILTQSSNNK